MCLGQQQRMPQMLECPHPRVSPGRPAADWLSSGCSSGEQTSKWKISFSLYVCLSLALSLPLNKLLKFLTWWSFKVYSSTKKTFEIHAVFFHNPHSYEKLWRSLVYWMHSLYKILSQLWSHWLRVMQKWRMFWEQQGPLWLFPVFRVLLCCVNK